MCKKQPPVPAPVGLPHKLTKLSVSWGRDSHGLLPNWKGEIAQFINSAGTITGFQDSDRERGLDGGLIEHEVWGRAPALLGNSEGREGTNAVVTTTSITPCARALR